MEGLFVVLIILGAVPYSILLIVQSDPKAKITVYIIIVYFRRKV